MTVRRSIVLLACIGIAELAGIIGAVFTTPAIPGWYAALAKPELAPPNWIFAPVWTTLFALMGIALFLIVRKREEGITVTTALAIFALQLVLNTLWSIIFFGLESPGGAFIELVILWLAILWTIILFAKLSKPAAWLLAPYLLWVTFAGYLNYAIWSLN